MQGEGSMEEISQRIISGLKTKAKK
jgi:hypothetical protein